MDEAGWPNEVEETRSSSVQSNLHNIQHSYTLTPDQDQDQDQDQVQVQGQGQRQRRLVEEVEQDPRGEHTHLQHHSTNDYHHHTGEEEEFREEQDEEDDEEMDSTSGAWSAELDSTLRRSTSSSPTVSEAALSPEGVSCALLLSPVPPSLSAALQEIEERGDDALLPRCLHRIAEALVLEGDYERAVCFLQLQRLYHERVLSNIATLQEQWERRWRTVSGTEHSSSEGKAALPHLSDLEADHLEKLTQICRTHTQPAGSVEQCDLESKAQRNAVLLGERGRERVCVLELPCGGEQERPAECVCVMEGRREEVSLIQDHTHPEAESSTSPLSQQGEPQHLPQTSTDPPTLPAPPPCCSFSSSLTDTPPTGQSEGATEEDKHTHESEMMMEEEEEENGTDVMEREGGGGGGGGGGGQLQDTGQKEEEEEVEEGVEALQLDAGGEEQQVPELELEVSEESPELEDEEEQEEEGQGVETLEVEKVSTLDDLAKRIQVEEITPAAGLVSILKRRVSLEDPSATPVTPKPVGKRKVRFRVPDDGLDHDDVGGDSWLLLLLLCLATVVISLGGTALYCAFGDAQSSVCTDFSHNLDFYVGQVQRGVDEVRHWFSPGS